MIHLRALPPQAEPAERKQQHATAWPLPRIDTPADKPESKRAELGL